MCDIGIEIFSFVSKFKIKIELGIKCEITIIFLICNSTVNQAYDLQLWIR